MAFYPNNIIRNEQVAFIDKMFNDHHLCSNETSSLEQQIVWIMNCHLMPSEKDDLQSYH